MASEYAKAFRIYDELIDTLKVANSGCVTLCDSAQEFYDADETAAEEDFSNFLDAMNLELLVSLEDCLRGEDLEFILEDQIVDSFINGQFMELYNKLDDKAAFLEYADDKELEAAMLRLIIKEGL